MYFQYFRLFASFFSELSLAFCYIPLLEQFPAEYRKWCRIALFSFTLFCDWSRKLALQSQPIKCKTKNNNDLVTRVFPRIWEVACFYFESSLVNNHGNLLFWLTVVINLVLIFRYSVEKCSIISSCDHFGFGCRTPSWNALFENTVFYIRVCVHII